MIIFHFEGMSFSSAHDLKQWDFLDNNEIFSEFAQFIRQHILTILTIKQLVVKRPSLTRCGNPPSKWVPELLLGGQAERHVGPALFF